VCHCIKKGLCHALEWYTMEYPTSHLYFLAIYKVCQYVYQEDTSEKWDIAWYAMRE